MSNASPYAARPEIGEVDSVARCPLITLLGFALIWLVVGGALALLNLIQLRTPGFLADCSFLSYGRLQAIQETAIIYGWAINAGLVVGLWLLSRLGDSALRATRLLVGAALFWNAGVLFGLIGIATGDATSFSLIQLPASVQPLMLAAFAAMAVTGILAWTGRSRESTYVSQWYVFAALFLFAWLFSIAQVMLFFAPVRGVLQAVVANWYAQGVWSLLLAPIALGAAYYLVPKVTGRTLPSYTFAPHAFWTLILLGSWTGGRHLVGSAVPAWVGASAIVAGALMLFHYAVVFINLRGVFAGGGTSLKFVGFGVIAYLLEGISESVFSFYRFAHTLQFTFFAQAQLQLAILGAFSLIVFGALYFILPRLTGKAWPSIALIRFHFVAAVLGVILLVAGLAIAGYTQGHALNDASLSFADISGRTRPWLLLATVGQAVFWLGNLAFVAHVACLLRSVCCQKTETNPFRTPGQMEVPVS